MRVRHIISERKQLQADTGWRTDDLTRRHAPIFPKTKPIRAGWKWRSAKVHGASGQFVLLAQCNPNRDNWKAILLKLDAEGSGSAVCRFEYHGSHPGLHAHGHCQRSGIEIGPSGLDDLVRAPKAGPATYHRRHNAWTENGFWETTKRFFRIRDQSGPLL